MGAEEALRQGELEESLHLLQEQVRREPANARYRIFLFQLLAVMGRWGRALTQLEVAGELDAGTLAMVQTYREALRCEVLRANVFSGKRSPLIFGRPEEWLALLLEAQRLLALGEGERSASLRELALEAAPPTSGRIDDSPFAWIMDGDIRLGPVLETIVNGHYYWIPFQRIRGLALDKPQDLRDLVWMPAHFTWVNGGESAGLIPTRYPGSEVSADPELRLSRRTEWLNEPNGAFLGQGQRMFFTDSGEYPLMNLRLIVFDTVPDADPTMHPEKASLG
ncbi:MAG: virulence protein SciE type [Chromatiaceae bacterium]|jgi:type VI secretion system protein ImpE|nr:virulence protein SciE type [Candidatus Thioaporhodococcus sediminis]